MTLGFVPEAMHQPGTPAGSATGGGPYKKLKPTGVDRVAGVVMDLPGTFRERSPYDLGFQRELRSDLPHSSTAHWCPTSPEPPTYEESMAMYPVSPSRCPPEPLSHLPSKHYNITVTGGSLNININHTGGPNKKSIPQTGTLKDKERDLRHELTIRSVNRLAKQLSKTSNSEAHPVEIDVEANPLVYSLVPVQGGRRLWACACPPHVLQYPPPSGLGPTLGVFFLVPGPPLGSWGRPREVFEVDTPLWHLLQVVFGLLWVLGTLWGVEPPQGESCPLTHCVAFVGFFSKSPSLGAKEYGKGELPWKDQSRG